MMQKLIILNAYMPEESTDPASAQTRILRVLRNDEEMFAIPFRYDFGAGFGIFNIFPEQAFMHEEGLRKVLSGQWPEVWLSIGKDADLQICRISENEETVASLKVVQTWPKFDSSKPAIHLKLEELARLYRFLADFWEDNWDTLRDRIQESYDVDLTSHY